MLNPGQILDEKYEVIKVLGQGGMSTVYLCKNNRLGNLWAIKEVDSKWKNKIDFLAEPNILKNLSHIGIIRIVDIFHENDNLYIVEDYIEGNTLKEHVDAKGALSSELVADITLQLCSVLEYLHSFNPPIIYRDLKPSNIIIKSNNKVVLIDFGIARSYKEGQEGDTMILGSMGYVAPEQLENVQSNAQTDIYSLGATMFFMLTGKAIRQPLDIMDMSKYPEGAYKSLVGVIQKASAINPENRYNAIKMMLPELNAIIANREDTKTIFMNSNESDDVVTKTVLALHKKPRKKTKLMIIALLACIIALVIFLVSLMGNKLSDKKVSEAPTVAKTVEPKKEVVEEDTIVKGFLDLTNPIQSSSSGSSNKRSKGKDKNQNKNLPEQFILNPAATISNSKLSISLTNMQVIDNQVTAILSIENRADADLKLDLSKTYLVNAKNESVKGYSSTSLISIPKGSSNQEVKVFFNDFNFEEGALTLKTVLISQVNKDINLSVDVKK